MTYRPKNTKATCAWCGQEIEFRPIPDDHAYEAGFPWVSVADFGVQWGMTAKALTRTCYDENPHVPNFDIVVSREGAAHRTADELAALFVLDVAALIGLFDDNGLFRHGKATKEQRLDVNLAANTEGWCDDPDDSQALSDLIPTWESNASDAGYGVAWDDGYQIWRIAE